LVLYRLIASRETDLNFMVQRYSPNFIHMTL
jgi:hypothetical protein